MKALIFQHTEAEHPAAIGDYLTEAGVTWSVMKWYAGEAAPALDDVDMIFVLGGPQEVWQESRNMWLADEKKTLFDAIIKRQIPTLGIDLGHHLIATALGGAVQSMQSPQVGVFEVEMTYEGAADPLLYGIDATTRVFQWHSSEVVRLPEGADVLAASQVCAIQAVRYGRNAYGIQFQPEMRAEMLATLTEDPAYADGLKKVLGENAAAQLLELAKAHNSQLAPQGRRLYQNFLTIVREGALVQEASMELSGGDLSDMDLSWKADA